MAKRRYNCAQVRVVNNGWEVDAIPGYSFRSDEGVRAQNTFVFDSFAKLAKWLEDNIKPTGDE